MTKNDILSTNFKGKLTKLLELFSRSFVLGKYIINTESNTESRHNHC